MADTLSPREGRTPPAVLEIQCVADACHVFSKERPLPVSITGEIQNPTCASYYDRKLKSFPQLEPTHIFGTFFFLLVFFLICLLELLWLQLFSPSHPLFVFQFVVPLAVQKFYIQAKSNTPVSPAHVFTNHICMSAGTEAL